MHTLVLDFVRTRLSSVHSPLAFTVALYLCIQVFSSVTIRDTTATSYLPNPLRKFTLAVAICASNSPASTWIISKAWRRRRVGNGNIMGFKIQS